MENLIIKIGIFIFLFIFIYAIISIIIHIVKRVFDKELTIEKCYDEYFSALHKCPEPRKFLT